MKHAIFKSGTISSYVMKYKPQLLTASIGGIIYNTVIVAVPIFLGKLIDATALHNINLLLLTALSYLAVTAFVQFARYVKRWYIRDQFNHLVCDMRLDFATALLNKSLPALEKESAGDLMSRTVGDIALVTEAARKTVTEIFDTWLLMLSYFVALLVINPKVTLIASLMIPLTILLAQKMRHTLYQYSLAVRKAAASANIGLKRYLDGIFILRLFGQENTEAQKASQAFASQADYAVKELLLKQALLPIYALLAGAGVVIAIGLLADSVVTGAMSIGMFNSYIIMFGSLAGRTQKAAEVFNQWHGASAAWARIKEKMADSDEKAGEKSLCPIYCDKIELDKLCFAYEGKPVLHNVSLSAHKGELIGVTGPIGSGKTALAKALTGLYPYQGSIRLQGAELRDIEPLNRCRLIAYTGHEQSLFSLTIEENIAFGCQKIETGLLEKALTVSALKNDIARFDMGLATQVGEKGYKISGGQRQRIALARCVYANTDILLLDDPFSAVDIATEQDIIQAIRTLLPDKIVFIFTHRLTAFSKLDQVILLQNGQIGEMGQHEDLMSAQGIYQKIYTAQSFMEVQKDEE